MGQLVDDAVRRRRRISPWLVVFLVVLVNLPVGHSTYLNWRLDRSGVETTAALTNSAESGGTYGVEFEYGPDIDPDASQPRYTARVDRSTYDRAVRTGVVEVRVLSDRPSAYEVRGQVTSRAALVVTLVADLLLLAMVALLRVRRSRRRDERLHLVAIEDVQRCAPGSGLDRLDETTYVVIGEVCLIDETGIELDVDGRPVRVDLGGHANPVGYQQPARVTARLSDWRA